MTEHRLMLRKREGLQNPVNVGGFHIILGLATFPDGIFDALDSTHIHSFPFVVIMSLRVAAALVRFEVEHMALDHTVFSKKLVHQRRFAYIVQMLQFENVRFRGEWQIYIHRLFGIVLYG